MTANGRALSGGYGHSQTFGHRGSTTDRERAAADYLCEQIRSIGLEPQRESFKGSSSYGGRILIHVIVATLGSALPMGVPNRCDRG